MSERKKEYAKYLRSADWKARRDKFYDHYEHKCAVCGDTEQLNIHHLHYDHIGCEESNDVICLCKTCHYNAHRGRLKIWVFTKEQYRHFLKVRDIVVEKHCDHVFRVT